MAKAKDKKTEKRIVPVEENPEFPRRLFTKDDEPCPEKSIQIFSSTPKLFDALKEALRPSEWDQLFYSKLGVFLQYHEKKISWASRLGHYMLSFQLACSKQNEIWSLIGKTPIRLSLNEFEVITGLNCEYIEDVMYPAVEVTDEMRDFWVRLGTSVEVGPTYEELVKACGRCEHWESDDRVRLGYLAIIASCIDAHSHTSPIDVNLARLVMDLESFVDYPWGRVAFKKVISSVKVADITRTYHIHGFAQILQSWAYFALPGLAADIGMPFEPPPRIPLLAFRGSRGRKNIRPCILKQTEIVSCAHREFSESFPRWDDDVEDLRILNILRAIFGEIKVDWRWKAEHWPSLGVMPSNKPPGNKGIKREIIAIDEVSSKKARLDDDEAVKNMISAVMSAMETRFDKLEFIVLGVDKKVSFLSERVEEVMKRIDDSVAMGMEKEDDAGGVKENPVEPEQVVGCEVKAAAADVGSSVSETRQPQNEGQEQAQEPSVVIYETNVAAVDFNKVKREKQSVKEKAAALVAKEAAAKFRREQVLSPPLVPTVARGRGYDPFGSVDKKHRDELSDFLKNCPLVPTYLM